MSVALRSSQLPSRRPSTIAAVSVAFSWAALVLFAAVLPLRFVFLGAITSAPFFGVQPDAGQRAASEGYFIAASSSATGVAITVFVITLLFRAQDRRFMSGWIVSGFASVSAGLLWLLAVSHAVSLG